MTLIILGHGQGICGAPYGTCHKVMDPKNAMASTTLKKTVSNILKTLYTFQPWGVHASLGFQMTCMDDYVIKFPPYKKIIEIKTKVCVLMVC